MPLTDDKSGAKIVISNYPIYLETSACLSTKSRYCYISAIVWSIFCSFLEALFEGLLGDPLGSP